jgi:hypothetical protein
VLFVHSLLFAVDCSFVWVKFALVSCLSANRVTANTTKFNTKVNRSHLTYLLTPYSTVLFEKLTGLQLVKKFPALYKTRWFITASARHLSLPWASAIQSIPPTSQFLKIRLTIPGTKSHVPVPFLRSYQSVSPGPRLCEYFVTKTRFHGEKSLVPRPTPKLVDHPLSAVRDCWFNVFAATLHIHSYPPYSQLPSIFTATLHIRSYPPYSQLPSIFAATLHIRSYPPYLQLPSIFEAYPPSVTRGPAMPWWQYNFAKIFPLLNKGIYVPFLNETLP